VCDRPFTVFRWRPGADARYKKTEVCQTCAKTKNVCQTCLLDLQYGLPTQVIDTALAQNIDQIIPTSDVHREYFTQINEQRLADGTGGVGKAAVNPVLNKLARNTPYYKRNLAHICSFWVKGNCTRGSQCPYRHANDHTDPDLAHQNIKDRYFGKDDPVAAKMLRRAAAVEMTPPEDKDVKTLYVGNVPISATEEDIRDAFYAYGELSSIKLVPQKLCAFVTYSTREGAERAAAKLYTTLTVRGVPCRLAWGKSHIQDLGGPVTPALPKAVPLVPQQQAPADLDGQTAVPAAGVAASAMPVPTDYFSIPVMPSTVFTAPVAFGMTMPSFAGGPKMLYPSMNPQRMGATEKQ